MRARLAVAVLVTATVPACSLLTNFSGLTGGDGIADGGPDAKAHAEGGADARRPDGPTDAGTDTHGPDGSPGVDAGKDAQTDGGRDVELDSTTPTDVPRPISPLSTSRVTSRTPKLTWALPAGISDATIDLCSQRACGSGTLLSSTFVTGTSYSPTTALPIGVVYWRVHPSNSKIATSPTWEFTVGALSAPVDTSWGTTLDVNGDGYPDLIVGASGTPAAYVYMGTSSGLSTTPTTLANPGAASESFGYSVASAGDVNGDGYADIVVGAYAAAGSTGTVYVYYGSATAWGSSTPPTPVTLTSPGGAGMYFGASVASAGDVNGDGYADIVVGNGGAGNDGNTGTSQAYVFLGGPSGVPALATTLNDPDGAGGQFGFSVASAGDVNGDGYGDLVIGAPNASSAAGKAYVYLGGTGDATGLATTPASTLTGPTASIFGSSVACAGDVNGDGYADIIVGAPEGDSSGDAYVFHGSPSATGLASGGAANTLSGPTGGGEALFGGSVASAGDVNGDGYADVVVGAQAFSTTVGAAYIYQSSGTSGLPNVATTTLPGATGSQFGTSVASAGVTGLYAGVVVGAAGAGAADVYPGGSSGVGAAVTLTGPSGGMFGISVFGASN
jgi:hypothetical protein